MATLGPVTWPPDLIRTKRLALRLPGPRDRPAITDLYSSPKVGAHIGGAQSRDELERTISWEPRVQVGQFVVDRSGEMIGTVQVVRRDADFAVRPTAGKPELGYMFLPQVWGQGYAREACAAVLEWFASAVPGESVMVATNSGHARPIRLAERLGFVEVGRAEAFGAEQWIGEHPAGSIHR